jgi:hypothetical protein
MRPNTSCDDTDIWANDEPDNDIINIEKTITGFITILILT